jgi:hypothetical protein
MYVKFQDIDKGKVFFDEYSGDYWEKVSDTKAVLLEGDVGLTDSFKFNEMVVISENGE